MAQSSYYHLLQFLSIFMARVLFMVSVLRTIKIQFGQKKNVFGLLKKRRCNKDNPVEHWQCYLVNETLARLLHIKLIG